MAGTSPITLFHGEALFRAGQQATHFYLVTKGTIVIVDQAGVSRVRHFSEDEMFGIPEVLANTSWELTARADGPTIVMAFPATQLFQSLAEMPDTHSSFLSSMASMA